HMDMMKMRVNKNLVVLAKQEIKLEPLGKHLMLIELDPLIRETHSSKIIFHSKNCGTFDVVFKNAH
ncbi:MAG: copper chaperone PCu(A)C, partial [Pseudomonadota bacterium]|nr:copper chaperone PCu(A)C [Pseudomonadota bacterium]